MPQLAIPVEIRHRLVENLLAGKIGTLQELYEVDYASRGSTEKSHERCHRLLKKLVNYGLVVRQDGGGSKSGRKGCARTVWQPVEDLHEHIVSLYGAVRLEHAEDRAVPDENARVEEVNVEEEEAGEDSILAAQVRTMRILLVLVEKLDGIQKTLDSLMAPPT